MTTMLMFQLITMPEDAAWYSFHPTCQITTQLKNPFLISKQKFDIHSSNLICEMMEAGDKEAIQALCDLYFEITSDNAAGWFSNAGYW